MENKIYKCDICGCDTTNDQSVTLARKYGGYHIEAHRCDACDHRLDLEIDWQAMGETIQETNIICPYCGYEYGDYEGYGFDAGDHDEVECDSCGKHFDLEVVERRTYSTKRSVCDMPEDFNGEESDE